MHIVKREWKSWFVREKGMGLYVKEKGESEALVCLRMAGWQKDDERADLLKPGWYIGEEGLIC